MSMIKNPTPEQLFAQYLQQEVTEDIWKYIEEMENEEELEWDYWDWL